MVMTPNSPFERTVGRIDLMSFSTLWRGMASPRGRSRIRRSVAWIAATSFLWSFILATPAQLMAQSALHPAKRLGLREL